MATKTYRYKFENKEVLKDLAFDKVLRTKAKIRHYELILNDSINHYYTINDNTDYVKLDIFDAKADRHIIIVYGFYSVYYYDTKDRILYEQDYDNELRV